MLYGLDIIKSCLAYILGLFCILYAYLVKYFASATRYCFRRVSYGAVIGERGYSIQLTLVKFVISLETKE